MTGRALSGFLVATGVMMSALMSNAAGAPAPAGKKLPSVKGSNLAGQAVRFPEDVAGRPCVLLVAYRRGTQADVDRWMEFVGKVAPGVALYEVPSISNPVWRPLSGWIDSGMRGGVPKEKWAIVVTLYEDAPLLKDFLGDFGGFTTHVVLLDANGRVVWFNAGGFTQSAAQGLSEALAGLEKGM